MKKPVLVSRLLSCPTPSEKNIRLSNMNSLGSANQTRKRFAKKLPVTEPFAKSSGVKQNTSDQTVTLLCEKLCRELLVIKFV